MNSLTLGNKKWSVATFSVFSETLTTEEIGQALGLWSTQTHVKGEPRGFRKRDASVSQSIVWPDCAWHLSSPLGYETKLEDHIAWLLDVLAPKLNAINSLAPRCRLICISCGFGSEHGQGGFTLASNTLSRLAQLGIPLVVDLYPPGPIELEDLEPELTTPATESHDS